MENFFSAIRMSCGNGNNPTAVHLKSAFKNLLCRTFNKTDDGNCYFNESIPVINMPCTESDICLKQDLTESLVIGNRFKHTVLVYIAGFINRVLMENESCILCFTFLKECRATVSCELIKNKQRGGLIDPIVDIVNIVKFPDPMIDSAIKMREHFSKFGKQISDDIVSEILICDINPLSEIAEHDQKHRVNMIKKIVCKFVSLKTKHLVRVSNQEGCANIRHKNNKLIIFAND